MRNITLLIIAVILVGVGIWLWSQPKTDDKVVNDNQVVTEMEITSPAFKNNQRIPDEYTCQGDNINPPLEFSEVPENALSLVLIVDDPDAPAGTWDHWLVYNIEPDTTGVAPNSVPAGGSQVTNSFGQIEYGGPCPPPGPDHRYFFKLYALDTRLEQDLIKDKPSLITAMQNHTLASAELIGLYSR